MPAVWRVNTFSLTNCACPDTVDAGRTRIRQNTRIDNHAITRGQQQAEILEAIAEIFEILKSESLTDIYGNGH